MNDEGDTFAAVMCGCDRCPLLEHLVIDFQTRATRARGDGAEANFGRRLRRCRQPLSMPCSWAPPVDGRGGGRARIEVSFTSTIWSLCALFRDTIAFLGDAMVR